MKIILILVVILFTNSAFAANKTAEDLVRNGLHAYKTGGARAAIEAWIKDSGIEGSKEALSQANTLRQVEDFYGTYESYEIVKTHKISKRSTSLQFVMNFDKGVAYVIFQAYKTKGGIWIATQFKFHTEAAQVWPISDVYGSK
ncbi:MAG: hypothetical protein V3V31_07875 [Methylococcales bacterium]